MLLHFFLMKEVLTKSFSTSETATAIKVRRQSVTCRETLIETIDDEIKALGNHQTMKLWASPIQSWVKTMQLVEV